jgi:hypothetical protein
MLAPRDMTVILLSLALEIAIEPAQNVQTLIADVFHRRLAK